jgi:hypothetical protein
LARKTEYCLTPAPSNFSVVSVAMALFEKVEDAELA